MKKHFIRYCTAGFIFALHPLCAEEAGEALTGREIMQSVRDHLPREPVEVQARLQSKRPDGRIDRVVMVDMLLDWGGMPPSAAYHLRDRFGEDLGRLELELSADAGPTHRFFQAGADEPDPAVDLFADIDRTDLTWSDLSFSFLWWPEAERAGEESKKGRRCFVVDLQAPGESRLYSGARVWVDVEVRAVLQVEFFDKNGSRVRKLSVKSFQKLDNFWTLKDLDVYRYPSRRKTTLRVQEMKVSGETINLEQS